MSQNIMILAKFVICSSCVNNFSKFKFRSFITRNFHHVSLIGTEPKFFDQISNYRKRSANYVSMCKKYGASCGQLIFYKKFPVDR